MGSKKGILINAPYTKKFSFLSRRCALRLNKQALYMTNWQNSCGNYPRQTQQWTDTNDDGYK